MAALALTLALGQVLTGPLRAFTGRQWEPMGALPEPDDWYLAYDDFHIDHYILYHGFGESMAHARAADALLMGNSRMQFAFPRGTLQRIERETGCRFFNLALGSVEGAAFALRLIEKHDLRPQFVIVNVDGLFFREEVSEFGQTVLQASHWEAWKTVKEHTLAGHVRHSALLEWLPRWRLPLPFLLSDPMIVYRSTAYGSWHGPDRSTESVGDPPQSSIDLDTVDREVLLERIREVAADWLANATAFKSALERRGTSLVMSWAPVPGQWTRRANAAGLARALGVPFISPIVPGLMTRDDEHLNDESGERFAMGFFEQFLAWADGSPNGCGRPE